MIFTEISVQEFLEGKYYKRTKAMQFVEDFVNEKIPVAMVSWQGEYANVSSCQSSITQAAKRLNKAHIKSSTRGDKVFIYNELLIGDLKEGRNGTEKDS